MKNKCKVPKCSREIYAKTKQLCHAHHNRQVMYGDVQAHIPIRNRRTIEEMQQRVIRKAVKVVRK